MGQTLKKKQSTSKEATERRIKLQFDRINHGSPLNTRRNDGFALTNLLNKLRDSKETLQTDTHRSGDLSANRTFRSSEKIQISDL